MAIKSHYQKIAEVRSFILEKTGSDIISSPTFNITPRFQDLHLFRDKLHENKKSRHFQLYSARKRSVRIYRLIFLAISFIFVSLAVGSYYHTWHWSAQLIVANSTTLKAILGSICMLFGLVSFTIACSMRTEKEAAHHLYVKAKHRLSKIYARKQLTHGVRNLFAIGNFCRRAAALKHMYNESLDKLQEYQDNTLHLLEKIYESPSVDWKAREVLYNQAIQELQDHLDETLIDFQHFNIEEQ